MDAQATESQATSAVTYHAEEGSTTGKRAGWSSETVSHRCQIVAAARIEIARRAERLVAACRSPQRVNDVETIASELIPLSDALRWIGSRGPQVLADRRVGRRGRPLWLWGVTSVVRRRPLGRVLILGTWNYPLLLPGVQVAQALAAGNEVLLKPAPGVEAATRLMIEAFSIAGVPGSALRQLDSDPATAEAAIVDGVDLVVLTGSAGTGRRVLQQTANKLTPTIMELSGCDAVIVLAGADVDRVIDAVVFGLLFNSGATCIGPRRLFLPTGKWGDEITERLLLRLAQADAVTVHPAARNAVVSMLDAAIAAGAVDGVGRTDVARMRQTGRMAPVVLLGLPAGHSTLDCDLFAPVLSILRFQTSEDAIESVNRCRYRLAASVFGSVREAESVAKRLDVGVVIINDLVAPTADPRLPFGGRGESGFGVTRGPEGLLAMTTPQVIATRRGRFAPHLSPRNDTDDQVLTAVLTLRNAASWGERWTAMRRLASAAKSSRRVKPSDP